MNIWAGKSSNRLLGGAFSAKADRRSRPRRSSIPQTNGKFWQTGGRFWIIVIAAWLLAGCGDATPIRQSAANLTPPSVPATATAIPLPTATATPLPTPTPTPLPTATPLPTPTPLPTATPLPTPTPVPFEIATLRKANQSYAQIQTLHFVLEVREGKVVINGGEIRRAEGNLQRPDRYQADIRVKVFIGEFNVKVIGLNGEQYMNDAFGNWNRSRPEETLSLVALLDPQKGVGPTLLKLQNPRLVGNETIQGVNTYHLQGTLNGPDAAPLTLQTLGKRDVTLDAWIAQDDSRVRQLYIKEIGLNPAFWVLSFSKFNDPVNIQKP